MTQLELPTPKPRRRKLSQLDAVERLMGDGKWRTFAIIKALLFACEIHSSEAGISARLRDLRNKRGYTVESRPVAKGRKLYEYRVTR